MVETRPLLQMVADRVAETLHVPRVAILLNERGQLRPAYAVGYGDVPQVAIPTESTTVRRLHGGTHVRVRFDDPDSWVHDVPAEERESLAALGPDVLPRSSSAATTRPRARSITSTPGTIRR